MARALDPAKWELWRQRFQEFEKGGMTVAEFCQQVAVYVATFYQWRRRLEESGRSPATKSEKALAVSAHHHHWFIDDAGHFSRVWFQRDIFVSQKSYT